MNKLYKCALGLLTAFALSFACFSNATFTCNNTFITTNDQAGYITFNIAWDEFYNSDLFCINNRIGVNKVGYSLNCNGQYTYMNLYDSLCIKKSENINTICMHYEQTGRGAWAYLNSSCLTQPYTSLQCQTEYNLIPISEVTANYCALNFGMIDPQECPINQGTGVIARSNLMINDIPYAQNQNINVFIPDFLAWNIAFNDFNTVIEVEGYNADEEYIENVINQEKLTPTNKDIENMITGFMTNYFPYLALAIVFLYLARKIFKLVK